MFPWLQVWLNLLNRAAYRTWGQRGQNEIFQNLGGGGNGMRMSKQLGGSQKSRGEAKSILGGPLPPSMQPCYIAV